MIETIQEPTTLPALHTQSASEILKHYPVMEIARAFDEGTKEIVRLMAAIGERCQYMRTAFYSEDGESRAWRSSSFDLDYRHNSQHYNHNDGAKLVGEMKREAWRILTDKLGLRAIMSVKKRQEFDNQLEKGELPEINERTIMDVLLGLCGQAKDFAKEASLEVFDILRPRGGYGGAYKTNDAFRVGRRVILPYRVEQGYKCGSFRPNYRREQDLIAIDGVFHLLDGKGVMRENRGQLVNAIINSPDGKGQTQYFAFKCFKKGTLHLEMLRLDLVKQLNLMATGEHVLGQDTDE